jgi:hypothetical protein
MSFMSRKYYTMLASGTLTTIVVSILLMAVSRRRPSERQCKKGRGPVRKLGQKI